MDVLGTPFCPHSVRKVVTHFRLRDQHDNMTTVHAEEGGNAVPMHTALHMIPYDTLGTENYAYAFINIMNTLPKAAPASSRFAEIVDVPGHDHFSHQRFQHG